MKLYAIRYGQQFKYGTEGTVYRNAVKPNKRIEDFAFLYNLIEWNGEHLLVDTGFRGEETAELFGVTLLPVEEEMKAFEMVMLEGTAEVKRGVYC